MAEDYETKLERMAEDRAIELARQKNKNRTLLKLMAEDGRDGNLEFELHELRAEVEEWKAKHAALKQMFRQERRKNR